jgi:hypothetical protein
LDLKADSFLELGPTRIVVRWGLTKTTRFAPFSPFLWTIVVETDPNRLTPILERVRNLLPGQPFCPMPTFEIDRLYRRRQLPWTAHSIKRGAVDEATRAAVAHNIPDKYASLLAKHVHPGNAIPDSTLRYGKDEIAKAELLGTQHVTRWL